MKILLTSGGTKVPLDRVRDVSNMSSGTFGSKIATELLSLGNEVIFLRAKGSKSPFSMNIDVINGECNILRISAWYNSLVSLWNRYKELQYRTFDDYAEVLERSIKIYQPDIVVLAAAVSDYGVENYVDGKIHSDQEMTIKLKPLPKLIGKVKEWMPTTKLVGFKLLVESADYKLIAAAQKSIVENKCDMVVANSLDDIKNSNHRVHLLFPDGKEATYVTDPNDPDYLARMVADHIVKL